MGDIHIIILFTFSLILLFQGIFTLIWMTFAWEYPKRIEENSSPKQFFAPVHSFSILVPVRFEQEVIAQTIHALHKLNYPDDKKEIILICRYDDEKTIAIIKTVLNTLLRDNIKLVVFFDLPINKPHALNIGLQEAVHDIVVVFDAEDEPHQDILQVANTIFLRDKPDVIQSGVQLMNFASSWFSTLNVLEYFAWFKSGLHFFASAGMVPLAGNTVFIKRNWIHMINTWDDHCLTEDADIGIRLATHKAKIRVVYDELHVTKEETPPNILSFIKQRTRWDQGFLQILWKGDWLKLPTLSQKLLTLYILASPQLQTGTVFFIPFSLLMIIHFHTPVLIAMFATLPIYIFLLQLIVTNILFYEFCRDFNYTYKVTAIFSICFYYSFFQIVLAISSLRAFVRFFSQHTSWEKTLHINAHRLLKQPSL